MIMTGATAQSAPVLSTPAERLLDDIKPLSEALKLSDEQIRVTYEIDRTIREIHERRWRRIALQFPDHMLPHSTSVYQQLSEGLSHTIEFNSNLPAEAITRHPSGLEVKLTILADTSYGSCCVDEIAAEHVDADAIVHYGRACLSPTVRLPVLYVYTVAEADQSAIMTAIEKTYPDRSAKIIITSDLPYSNIVNTVTCSARQAGYTNVVEAGIKHDPSALVPNRSLPDDAKVNAENLSEYSLYHIGEPPTALLLTLATKVKTFDIFDPTSNSVDEAQTARPLQRRYGLVTSMSTVGIWGILVNTLSVKNFLQVVERVKTQIAAAGKKSYLFVVGKLNMAKLANFAEIGGWVVIGCWESSLIDSKDFYRPILTPYELDLALMADEERVWTGAWRSDFEEVLRQPLKQYKQTRSGVESEILQNGVESDEESAPPEFDLRTGKYISQSRPMSHQRSSTANVGQGSNNLSNALVHREKGDLIAINGAASPAAAFLASKKTWQGLGSDFEIRYDDEEIEGARIEQGRTGVASGYTVETES